jgi:hypothetical protein
MDDHCVSCKCSQDEEFRSISVRLFPWIILLRGCNVNIVCLTGLPLAMHRFTVPLIYPGSVEIVIIYMHGCNRWINRL